MDAAYRTCACEFWVLHRKALLQVRRCGPGPREGDTV